MKFKSCKTDFSSTYISDIQGFTPHPNPEACCEIPDPPLLRTTSDLTNSIIFQKFGFTNFFVLTLMVIVLQPLFIVSSEAQSPNYRPRIQNLNQNAQEDLADLISEYTTKNILEQHECMPTM